MNPGCVAVHHWNISTHLFALSRFWFPALIIIHVLYMMFSIAGDTWRVGSKPSQNEVVLSCFIIMITGSSDWQSMLVICLCCSLICIEKKSQMIIYTCQACPFCDLEWTDEEPTNLSFSILYIWLCSLNRVTVAKLKELKEQTKQLREAFAS